MVFLVPDSLPSYSLEVGGGSFPSSSRSTASFTSMLLLPVGSFFSRRISSSGKLKVIRIVIASGIGMAALIPAILGQSARKRNNPFQSPTTSCMP